MTHHTKTVGVSGEAYYRAQSIMEGWRLHIFQPLTNRSADGKFEPPADGWYHGLPMGEFPNVEKLPDGTVRHALQIIDAKALTAMKNSFDAAAAKPNFPGLLIDFDHFSDDLDKSSQAAGWITAWENRLTQPSTLNQPAPGAWWQIRWSDVGDAAVRNGRFRFLSGVFPPEGWEFIGRPLKNAKTIEMKIRPLQLSGAGLTNKPNLKGMVPLSNRQPASADPADDQTKTTKNRMTKLAAFLGLSAEASEDAILTELTKLKNRATEAEAALSPLNNRVTELEKTNKSLLDGQVETDLEPLKNRLSEEEIKPLRDGLLKNREGTLPIVKTMISKLGSAAGSQDAGKKALTNRASAKTPADKAAASSTNDEEQVARERDKEVRDYRLKNRCTNAEAWDAVRRDKPELFGITASN